MRPLTLDDLLPLDEYANRRHEFFESLGRYLDRYRRIRIGPRLTLVFENRQTLWFRLQEVLRIARLAEPERVQEELDLYNRLLPGPGQLHAALLIEFGQGLLLTEELAPWQTLNGEALQFQIGQERFPAALLTCRPEDRCIGTAHWVHFFLDAAARRLLTDLRSSARFHVAHGDYQHQSAPLSEDIRQSLLDDLGLSDQD
jgi:uncharacterized protein DUF3501